MEIKTEKYTTIKCNDIEIWDDLVSKSSQGNIFCSSQFIKSLNVRHSFYIVKKGDEIIAGVPILEDEKGNARKNTHLYTSYIGILFNELEGQDDYKKITREFEITEFIINELTKLYGKFSLSLSPFFNDVRPFLWFNYNSPENGIFSINVRYTPILNLNFESEEDYLSQIRTNRRRELKDSNEYKILETDDISILNTLHKKTFNRQGINRSETEGKLLESITRSALENGYGRLSICTFKNEPTSAFLFLFDNKRGYYLFGANHPEYRFTGSSTKLMINNIFFTKYNRKLNEIDLVGANSPKRGDYKVSFNAQLKNYYEVFTS